MARLRQEDTTAAELAIAERRGEAIGRKIGNLTPAIAGVDDDIRTLLLGALASRAKQKHQLEDERAALVARRESWRAAESELGDLEAWCGRVAANLGDLTYLEKRQVLAALDVRVTSWRADYHSRDEITASLPLGMPAATPASVEQTRGTAFPPTPTRGS